MCQSGSTARQSPSTKISATQAARNCLYVASASPLLGPRQIGRQPIEHHQQRCTEMISNGSTIAQLGCNAQESVVRSSPRAADERQRGPRQCPIVVPVRRSRMPIVRRRCQCRRARRPTTCADDAVARPIASTSYAVVSRLVGANRQLCRHTTRQVRLETIDELETGTPDMPRRSLRSASR